MMVTFLLWDHTTGRLLLRVNHAPVTLSQYSLVAAIVRNLPQVKLPWHKVTIEPIGSAHKHVRVQLAPEVEWTAIEED